MQSGEPVSILASNDATLPKSLNSTGSFLTYEHEVILSVLGFDFDVLVCFAADAQFQTNVLGRYGFLMQIKLGRTLFVKSQKIENRA